MTFVPQAIRSMDESVYYFLNGYAGSGLLDRIAAFAVSNNLLKGGPFLAMYGYLWFRVGADQERRRRAIIAIFLGTMLALVVARTIANLAPFSTRPMYDQNILHAPYLYPVTADMEEWSSFPSDTATYFFALAFGLVYFLRRYTFPIMLYTAVWICLPRAFLGVHWASDIVVGAAIGIGLVWASIRSELLRPSLAGRVLAFVDARPGIFYGAAFLVCFEMAAMFSDVRAAAHFAADSLALAGLTDWGREHFRSALAGCALLGFVIVGGYILLQATHRHGLRARIAHGHGAQKST